MAVEIENITAEEVTFAEAARILGITHQTLSQYAKAGKLTSKKIGGVYLVNPKITRKELEQAGFYRRKESRKARWQKE